MSKIDLVLQGKGGVGKSFVAALLLQYYKHLGLSFKGYDTDPVNPTFSRYESLQVEHLELLKDNTIDTRRFDKLIENLLEADNTNFVIDNGASSFIPLTAYLIENDVFQLLIDNGHEISVHTVVTGGQAMGDTIQGFLQLANSLPKGVKLVVWVNEFWGEVVVSGKPFEQSKSYISVKDRVEGIISIDQRNPQTFGIDMKNMLEQKLTFDDVIESDTFMVMEKQRLKTVRNRMFEQMKTVM